MLQYSAYSRFDLSAVCRHKAVPTQLSAALDNINYGIILFFCLTTTEWICFNLICTVQHLDLGSHETSWLSGFALLHITIVPYLRCNAIPFKRPPNAPCKHTPMHRWEPSVYWGTKYMSGLSFVVGIPFNVMCCLNTTYVNKGALMFQSGHFVCFFVIA